MLLWKEARRSRLYLLNLFELDLSSFESIYDYLADSGRPIDENANLILQKENSQEVKTIHTALDKLDSPLLN